MSINEKPKRLRAKEIAIQNSITITTVWNYSKKGLLTPIRVSPSVTLFDAEEVENLFTGNKNFNKNIS